MTPWRKPGLIGPTDSARLSSVLTITPAAPSIGRPVNRSTRRRRTTSEPKDFATPKRRVGGKQPCYTRGTSMRTDFDDELDAVLAEQTEPRYTFTRGGAFILDTAPEPEPVWGTAGDVLMAEGEALIVAGGQGLGKTTLAQQLALGRAGLPEYAELLGFPVKAGAERVLYLAMDRPLQAARSFRRMVGEAMRDELDARLVVWPGPPPRDLAKHPALLLTMCQDAGADTAVVDSLKDAAVGLSDDEVGAGYNRARQTAVAAGVQLIELHHNRKAPSGARAERPGIDDLYGSTWLPSGAGSVLLLSGSPGDPIVGMHHVKQPSAEVGPFKVIHDHLTGRSRVWHAADLVLLARRPGGMSAIEAAGALFDTDKPTPSDKEKARRRLESLTSAGHLVVVEDGDKTTNRPRRWGCL